MSLDELENFFTEINQPAYRGSQVFNLMYNHLASDFQEMLNIPKLLREELNKKTVLSTLELINSEKSHFEETVKLIFKTLEGNFIESVIIPERKRITLCVSTQVGCPLDCKFFCSLLYHFLFVCKFEVHTIPFNYSFSTENICIDQAIIL